MPWYPDEWSKGTLLGLEPDSNTGYRATVWFPYTRNLFNLIREGSLLAVRNFSDRAQDNGAARDPNYEEYSILQIDQAHPWHYAIQGPGEHGYPAFTIASAESARRDWTEWDLQNRDDVSRIRCKAIPLRLAFRPSDRAGELPRVFTDLSKPMPGFEARVLTPQMTDAIINQNLVPENCITIGHHLVQQEVAVKLALAELLSLHFGVFGFTGAGKSNLVSTSVRRSLARPASTDGKQVFKFVLFDLMDEYTGLLIDQLVQHQYSRAVICGREAVDENLLQACEARSADPKSPRTIEIIRQAAQTWSERITLPSELRGLRDQFVRPLARLICQDKVYFYEPQNQQGGNFDLDLDVLLKPIGPLTFGSKQETQASVQQIRQELEPLLQQARQSEGEQRDGHLREMAQVVQRRVPQATANRPKLEGIIDSIRQYEGSRGALGRGVSISARQLVELLNRQPLEGRGQYEPSLTVVVGEGEGAIATFARQVIERAFEDRRTRSLLYPVVSFVFDEADVFISQETGGEGNVVEQATLLARRGRKFGLGLGIATQRIRYLNTSIMAQPHTYFISKLPRKSDREAVAEAFAISEESLEQSFGFSTGQWLIASHDATGLRGAPFPVQLPNANQAVRAWLQEYHTSHGRGA
jgi:hypothetical protein